MNDTLQTSCNVFDRATMDGSLIFDYHQCMVHRLAKPGNDILKSLTAEKAHLIHMAMGVVTEAIELMAGVETFLSVASDGDGGKSLENIVEESGDTEFYLIGFSKCPGYDPACVNNASRGSVMKLDQMSRSLVIEAGDLLDIVIKRRIVYNDAENKGHWNKINFQLARLHASLRYIYGQIGYTRRDILGYNVNKLEKGENARYKDGYSDQAAIARQDKLPGE